MLLSEMLGVERDTDFMVKGMVCVYKVIEDIDGRERIVHKDKSMDFWKEPYSPLLFEIIAGAPANIIHLPPPLTDEQRVVLMSLFTIGARYIGMIPEGWKRCFVNKPQKGANTWMFGETTDMQVLSIAHGMANCLDSLVSWSDPEPFDIGKALGVEG